MALRPVFRRLGLAAAAILALVAALAGGAYLYLRSSLPQVSGTIVVPGLHHAVTIARDADGVPLITAADDAGAAFGLGFAHAQDRLFQMELMRRHGAGRLAEIFGRSAVALDKQMRILGLYHLAEAEFAGLPPAVQRGLDAYAAGVNAFLATRPGALPPEFLLLRFAPAAWRPADSLVWGKLMDLLLASSYRNELLRAKLARTVSPGDLSLLFPDYPKDAPTTIGQLAALYRALPLDRLYAALPPLSVVGPIDESNDWVVDGAHSQSGKPLLANDPHLPFAAPGVWYLARLKTPEHTLAGATAPGAPFVVIGHNDRIAWGFTNTESDVDDLFIEKLDPADPARYLTPDGGAAAFTTREERIAVKGAAPVTVTVRATRHGPVLSDALPPDATPPGYVLALAAPFLIAGDTTAAAVWGIDRATDWHGFRDALRPFVAPQQNMVFAAADGTIGFIAPGRVPIRKHGDGWLPVPGWTGDNDWTGFIPFEGLPQATNPPDGHFASANNKIVPDGYRYFLSHDWDMPNRFERITALLAATPRQSPAASAAIQADTLSLAAQHLVPLMTQIAPADPDARQALDRLRGWNFRMDGDAVAPVLFVAWLRQFAHDVFFLHIGAAARDYWDVKPTVIEAVLRGHPEWCGSEQRYPRPNPPPPTGEGSAGSAPAAAEGCAALLTRSLGAAVAGLRKTYGPDMAAWRWRRVHVAAFDNPVFSRIPLLRQLFDPRIATDGGFDTVNRGLGRLGETERPYEQRFGAGLRIITDLASPLDSRMIAAPGQSGNPLSPHYADLLQRWRRFEYLVPGRAAAVATLTLEPAR